MSLPAASPCTGTTAEADGEAEAAGLADPTNGLASLFRYDF